MPPRGRRDARAHPQHEHEEAHRRPRAGGGRRGRGGRRLRAARRGRARRPHRARLPRSGRRRHRPAPADRPRARRSSRASRPRCVDATNPMVFVRAKDLGLTGTETPQAIDGDRALVARLEAIRVAAAEAHGHPGQRGDAQDRGGRRPPTSFTALDGVAYPAAADRRGGARHLHGQLPPRLRAHRRHVPGRRGPHRRHGRRRVLGAPDGPTCASAIPPACCRSTPRVGAEGGAPRAERVTVYRTARRLMEGYVRVP